MTFEEWWGVNRLVTNDGAEDAMFRAAWNAALEEAARRAVETSKRYTCPKMIGVCTAIAHEILRRDK